MLASLMAKTYCRCSMLGWCSPDSITRDNTAAEHLASLQTPALKEAVTHRAGGYCMLCDSTLTR